MAEGHAGHQTSNAYVISMTEDFCKSPSTPAAYTILQTIDVSMRQCTSVNGLGTSLLNMRSRITSVLGDEAGVGGGVKSGVNVGMCRPVADPASRVQAEGACVIMDGTIFEMNCHGAEGPGNTLGMLQYESGPLTYDDQRVDDDGARKSTQSDSKDLKRLSDKTLPDGRKVEVSRVTGMGTSHYAKGKIFLGEDADEFTMANEWQTALDDANPSAAERAAGAPGELDNVSYDDAGRRMGYFEGEARSDEASANVPYCRDWEWLQRSLSGRGRVGCSIGDQRDFYRKRGKAFREVDERLRAGDRAGADAIMKKYPTAVQIVMGG
jgi:hypothetical protein